MSGSSSRSSSAGCGGRGGAAIEGRGGARSDRPGVAARNRPRSPRPIVQAAVLAALLTVPAGLFHLTCPFGGVETLTRVFAQGLYVPKTGLANLLILGAVLVSALIAGPVFCGWICPLGSVQDWVRALGRKLGIRALNLPSKAERALSLGRYLVLGLIIWSTAQSFNLAFMKADPYYALLHFWTGEVAPAALAIAAIVLAASIFVARPWCRWLCPMGALMTLLGRFSVLKIKRPADCVDCRSCARACPVGLDLSKEEATSDRRCIRCGDCAAACPPRIGGRRRWPRLAQVAVAAALLAVFAAVPALVGKSGGAHRGTSVEARAALAQATARASAGGGSD